MVIVWDERKRKLNLEKHGIDFAGVHEGFFAEAMIGPAKRGRYLAVGWLDRAVVVIHAKLGDEGVSIVSARRANRKERELI